MESMGQNQVTQPLEAQVSETVNVQTMTTNSQYHGDFANSCQGNLLISANSFEFNAITSLSDDSGVPLTNSSISSGDSIRLGCCKCELELVESDGEVSQFDSLENCSDGGMSAENFNTLKKGPIPPIDPSPIDPPPEFQDSPHTTLLRSQALQNYASRLSSKLIQKAMPHYSSSSQKTLSTSPVFKELEPNDSDIGTIDMIKKQIYASDSVLNKQVLNIYDEPSENYYAFNNCKYLTEAHKRESEYFEMIKLEQEPSKTDKLSLARLSEIHEYEFYYGLKKTNTCDSYSQLKTAIMYSPMNHHTASNISTGNRPNSRNSLSSRLSSSHNSLCVPNANKADDSIFITQAMSHDALLSREISDFYNVPLDSDIYALPIDMIKPDMKHFYREEDEKFPKNKFKYIRNNKKRRRNIVNETSEIEKYGSKVKISRSGNKRHSVPENLLEPMHMTLDEVKHFYHTLYSNTSEVNEVFTSENSITKHQKCCSNTFLKDTDRNLTLYNKTVLKSGQNTKNTSYHKKNKLTVDTTPQKDHNHNSNNNYTHNKNENKKYTTHTSKKSQFSINLKQKLCSIFRFRKSQHNNNNQNIVESLAVDATRSEHCSKTIIPEGRKFCTRALPPLPSKSQNQIDKIQTKKSEFNSAIHFASNIEKVKNYGWYWGPISSEAAEKVLLNEPDGSFIVRDSSDDHYIFSLSFKLNSCVRHVRIEQDQGTFSFGTYAKFKSQTITEFIEKAVEHSRSGRYLFFLHRRPEHGPMRVQLTNPVSRFKHIQSLQHMCRFVVLKAVVRKDLVQSLPLPRRLLDYLSYKHCYSEQIESDSSQSQASTDAWL